MWKHQQKSSSFILKSLIDKYQAINTGTTESHQETERGRCSVRANTARVWCIDSMLTCWLSVEAGRPGADGECSLDLKIFDYLLLTLKEVLLDLLPVVWIHKFN